MQRSWMLGGVGGLLLASVLWGRPGTVKTRDGQVFVGDVTEHADQVTIQVKGIETSVPRDNLRSISYADSIEQEYRKRLARLTAYDVPGRIELAQWLFENHAYDFAQDVLQEARQLQPRNQEVVQMIRTVARQAELAQSEARKHEPVQLAAADNNLQVGGGGGGAPSRTAGGRMLTPEEINLVKQSEWQEGQSIRPTFRDDVRRKYIARSGADPAQFNRLTPSQQAWAIVRNGTPEMKKDVVISDPPAMAQFKKVQQSLLYTGCANCHSNDKAMGNFSLHFPADSEAATYTNFMILQKYTHKEGDRTYGMIERERPGDSLLVQYSLPMDIGSPPHPKAPNYKGAVHTRGDPRLKTATDWISSLNPIAPDYSEIDLSSKPAVAPRAPAPATSRPAAPARPAGT